MNFPTREEILDAVAIEGSVEESVVGEYINGMDLPLTQKVKMKSLLRQLYSEAYEQLAHT